MKTKFVAFTCICDVSIPLHARYYYSFTRSRYSQCWMWCHALGLVHKTMSDHTSLTYPEIGFLNFNWALLESLSYMLACPLSVGYLTGEINIGKLSHYSGPIIAESAIVLRNSCVVQNRDTLQNDHCTLCYWCLLQQSALCCLCGK